MIRTRTVLVLGAAASLPYGFPVGAELRRRICMSNNRNLAVALRGAGVADNQLEDLVEIFRRWGPGSIDRFLEEWSEFAEVGKLAIAATLIPAEIPAKVFPGDGPHESWYELLWTALAARSGLFRENQLSVITFNYDRSLEYYLWEHLAVLHRGNLPEALRDYQSVEIIHVYGSLGDLPVYGGTGRAYSPELEPYEDILISAASRIHIANRDGDEPPDFQRARELLESAHRIVFLGFGFHEENVDRLGRFREPWDERMRARTHVAATIRGWERDTDLPRLKEEVLKGALAQWENGTPYEFLRFHCDLTA